MRRVAMAGGETFDPVLVPGDHAIEQAHGAAVRHQRLDAGVVERGRIQEALRGGPRVAISSTLANGVPWDIGRSDT